MKSIKKLVQTIRSEHPECPYHGYKTDNTYLYVYLYDTYCVTGDGINIVRMILETGRKEESCGFIIAVEDWDLNMCKGWGKDF